MAKYRIIKMPQYNNLYSLQKKSFFWWYRVVLDSFKGVGSLEECQRVFEFYKKYITKDDLLVVHEEEF